MVQCLFCHREIDECKNEPCEDRKENSVTKYTLATLKEFLNGLSEQQLTQKVNIAFEDCPVQELWGHEIQSDDVYIHIDDEEDIRDLEAIKGDPEVSIDQFKICLAAGTIIFY